MDVLKAVSSALLPGQRSPNLLEPFPFDDGDSDHSDDEAAELYKSGRSDKSDINTEDLDNFNNLKREHLVQAVSLLESRAHRGGSAAERRLPRKLLAQFNSKIQHNVKLLLKIESLLDSNWRLKSDLYMENQAAIPAQAKLLCQGPVRSMTTAKDDLRNLHGHLQQGKALEGVSLAFQPMLSQDFESVEFLAGDLRCLAVSSSGTRVAVSDCSGVIQVWVLRDGQFASEPAELPRAGKGMVSALCFGGIWPSVTLAAGGEDRKVAIWRELSDPGDGNALQWEWLPLSIVVGGDVASISYHTTRPPKLAVGIFLDKRSLRDTGDAVHAAVEQDYSHIEFWDLTTAEQCTNETITFKGVLLCCAHSPDKSWLAVSTSGRPVCLIPGAQTEGKRLWLWGDDQDNQQQINAMAWDPKGTLLAAASVEGVVIVWNVMTRLVERVLSPRASAGSHSLLAVAFSPDGKAVAAGGNRSVLTLWNLESNGIEREWCFDDAIKALVFTEDTPNLAVGLRSKRIGLLRVDRGAHALQFSAGASAHAHVLKCRTQANVEDALALELPTKAKMRKTSSWGLAALTDTNLACDIGKHEVLCVALDPNGTRLAVGLKSSSVSMVSTRQEVATPTHRKRIGDSSGLLGAQPGHRDSCVVILELFESEKGNNHMERALRTVGDPVAVSLFTQKCDQGKSRGSRVTTAELLASGSTRRQKAPDVPVAPCSSMVAAIERDRLHVWSLDGLKPRLLDIAFNPSDGSEGLDIGQQAMCLSIAPSGMCIVTGDRAGSIVVVHTWMLAEEDDHMMEIQRHGRPVLSVCWSPDGQYLAAADKLRIRVWSVDTKAKMKWKTFVTIDTRWASAHALAFCPNYQRQPMKLAGPDADGDVAVPALAARFGYFIKVWTIGPFPEQKQEVEFFNLPKENSRMKVHSEIAFSPLGKSIAAVSEGMLHVWVLDGKKSKARLTDPGANMSSMSIPGDAFAIVFSRKTPYLSATHPRYAVTVQHRRIVVYDLQQCHLSFHLPDLMTLVMMEDTLAFKSTLMALPYLAYQRLLPTELNWQLLHWACFRGFGDFARELISFGVSPFALDSAGRNAIDLALLSEHLGVVDVVLRSVTKKPALMRNTLSEHHEALTLTVINLLEHELIVDALVEFLDTACLQTPRLKPGFPLPQRSGLAAKVAVNACWMPVLSKEICAAIAPTGDSERLVDVVALYLRGALDRDLRFIDALRKIPNAEENPVLRTRTVHAILYYKWESHAKYVFLKQFGAYLLYLSLFILWMQVYYCRDEGERMTERGDLSTADVSIWGWTILVACMYIATIYFMVYEIKQVVYEARSHAAATREHFKVALLQGIYYYLTDPWNVLDLLRIGFVCYVIVMDRKAPEWAASIAVLLMWARLIFFCRGFQGTGALVRIMVLIMAEMRPFVLMMGLIWIGFSHTFFILHRVDPFLDLEDDREGTFFDILMWTYRLTFLAESEVGDDRYILVHILWVVATFFSCIVLLNLLIAIMSSTYERTQRNAVCSQNKERAELVYELETIMPPCQPPRLYIIASFARGFLDMFCMNKRDEKEKEFDTTTSERHHSRLRTVIEQCDELKSQMHVQESKLDEVARQLPGSQSLNASMIFETDARLASHDFIQGSRLPNADMQRTFSMTGVHPSQRDAQDGRIEERQVIGTILPDSHGRAHQIHSQTIFLD